MSAKSLRADAERYIAEGLDWMPVVLPKGVKRPAKWPRGELLCENSDGGRVFRINIAKLVKWLDFAEEQADRCDK